LKATVEAKILKKFADVEPLSDTLLLFEVFLERSILDPI